MDKTIFLIEDEILIREMYELVLRQAGFNVVSAEDGEEALEYLGRGEVKYDLILLDIMIPKMNGMEVLKVIKNEGHPAKDIPVILLTNLGQESVLNEGIALGASKYLIKSNTLPRKVVEEVKQFLGPG